MQKIDPINYGYILSKAQYFAFNSSSEMTRGGDISEKLLYLYFNKNKQLFPNVKDDDELIQDNQIQLLVNKKSFLYLVGTTLEFSDGLNGKGFVFNNPNASRTCGCGESFSL